MRTARAESSIALQRKILCVLIILSLLGQATPSLARGPVSPAGRIPDESWLITWRASVDASASGNGTYATRRSHAKASIVVNYYDDGTSEYYVNEYSATYYVDLWDYDDCGETGGQNVKHFHADLLDPARYDGRGPVTPNIVMANKPTKLSNNKWYLNAVSLVLGPFEMSYLRENTPCRGATETYREKSNGLDFTEFMTSQVRTILTSENGPVFYYDVNTDIEHSDYDLTYPVHLEEHLTVELIAGRDLTVRDIEVTQGLQLNNAIPLVQGRRTIVRAYIGVVGDTRPVPNVTGILRVWDGDKLLSERPPFNASITAKNTPDWKKIGDTLNFSVPWLATQHSSLRFEVIVNDRRQVNEINYQNNTSSVTLSLENCEPLKIGYVPIRYAPPGVTPASPDMDIARAHEFMAKVYPVADDELLYKPMPGITWNKTLGGNTSEESYQNGQALIGRLDYIFLMTHDPSISRIIGWLPANASSGWDSMADIFNPRRVAWVEEDKTPLNIWRVLMANELGYTYGAEHNQSTTGGYHWFDVYERLIKPGSSYLGLVDFMYAPSPLPESDTWVSPQTYNRLYNEFCSGGSQTLGTTQAQAADDVLVISGNMSLTDTPSGQLEPLYRTAGTLLTPPPGSSYYVVLKNGTTELASYGFSAYPEIEETPIYTPTVGSFALGVPYPAGLNRVDLTDQYGQVLSSRIASAHPPAVTVQFPNAAGLALDGVQTIQWTGSDPDGDALTYSVLYSKDSGVTWNALSAGIAETSYAVDFATIPGSSSALIKVLASDGFNTGSDVSDQPFSVPSKLPVAGILSPADGAHFLAGEEITLQGYAIDLEEGAVAQDSLNWSSDRDGALGTGNILEVTLSEGTHTITLDVGGGAASVTTTVVIEAALPPTTDGYSLFLPMMVR